jgi:creatinine amidohydrolase/Fe(II)-dependent formamide hydrolase-like protein
MKKTTAIWVVWVACVGAVAGQQPPRSTASVNTQPRVDVLNMSRPIEMHDSIWIEDLTMMEVRDLLKAGKTTAIIMTGGIEENGPYLTTGKHNNVLRVMGDPIARGLGNALVAPIVTLEPGNPERVRTPGTVFLSPETYRAVLSDMAVSLKTQGFKDIVLIGDSGGNMKPMQEVADALNAKWKGDGPGKSDARAHFIAEYYNYDEVEKFEQSALGIHEQMEGLHDDYYISSLIMVHDVNGVRLPERIKANKATINAVPLTPAEKTIENGKKIAAFRAEKTIAAIKKSIAAR